MAFNELEQATWQRHFQQAIRDPMTLCQRLELPAKYHAGAVRASRDFPVFAPESYVGRMELGNAQDPLLRQVLPLEEELDEVAGFSSDPVGDQLARRQPGLIHKYRGRVLLIMTGLCAVHCRYCFRRHYAYEDDPQSLDQFAPALDQIESDHSIHEVILSGGDPLSLSDRKLGDLVARLSEVQHLERLRVHTRLPIVIPSRVNDDCLAWLRETRLQVFVVVHANHVNELDDEVLESFARLRSTGATLLNQAVLLRGVNDSLPALRDLCLRLSNHGVLPYYLNQLDRVRGAAHFEVDVERGMQLIDELRRHVPGYAVPKYVRETAGAEHKIVLRA